MIEYELHPSYTEYSATEYRRVAGSCSIATKLAAEVPVAIVLNGISHAVMMASPMDLHDFALGFCLSEGVLESPKELYDVEAVETEEGIQLVCEIAASAEWRLKERKRLLAGRTGCGICGIESFGQLQYKFPNVATRTLNENAIFSVVDHLRGRQTLSELTRATHAAAWVNLSGGIEYVREDVGRHNALDKLIGALVKSGTNSQQGFIYITSRASYEMVQKSILFGTGFLVAASAPTELAIRLALKHNLALTGYAREQSLIAYTFPERIVTN